MSASGSGCDREWGGSVAGSGVCDRVCVREWGE